MGNYYSPTGNFEVWDIKPEGYYTEEDWEVVKPIPPEPTFEEQIAAAYADFDARVEARLNAFAATRRYSSINSACSYSTSTDPQFQLEGEYCVQARDLTYRKCYDLLAEYMPAVLAGERPIPSWEEIEAQLPPLVWPDEQVETETEGATS